MKVIAKHVIKVISPNKDRIFAILSRRLISDNVINHVELPTPGIAFVMAKESAVLNNKPVVLNEYKHMPDVCRFIEAHSDAKGNAEVIEVIARPMADLSGRWTIEINIQANSTYRNVWDNIMPVLKELDINPKDFEILEFVGSETRRDSGLWYLPKERFLLELAGQSNDGFARALHAVDVAAEKISKEIRPPRWATEYHKLIDQAAKHGSEVGLALYHYWTNAKKSVKAEITTDNCLERTLRGCVGKVQDRELTDQTADDYGEVSLVLKRLWANAEKSKEMIAILGDIPKGIDLDAFLTVLKIARGSR